MGDVVAIAPALAPPADSVVEAFGPRWSAPQARVVLAHDPSSAAFASASLPPFGGQRSYRAALETLRGARSGPDDRAERAGRLVGPDTREVIRARPEVVLVTTGYGMPPAVSSVADAADRVDRRVEDAHIYASAYGAVRSGGAGALPPPATYTHRVPGRCHGCRRTCWPSGGHSAARFTDDTQLARLREVSRWCDLNAAPTGPPTRAGTVTGADQGGVPTPARCGDLHQRARQRCWRRPCLGHLVRAMGDHVAAMAVGPVTAGPLRQAGISTAAPDRFRARRTDPVGVG